jgi:rhodanese-related sulfurtransferase
MRVAIARQILLPSASAARRAPLAPPAFGAAAARPRSAPPRLAAMSVAAAADSPARLSCSAAAELAASGAVRYVDVRTPEEFANAHPVNSTNVPLMLSAPGGGMAPNPGFLAAFEAACPDKSEQVLVGCAAGKRSEMAVGKLAAAGYGKLIDVEGGFAAWCAAGLPVSE